jgi:Tfp pilus assembly protein PilN
VPVMVGAGDLDLLHAFAFNSENIFEKNLVFINLRNEHGAFLISESGRPEFCRETSLNLNGHVRHDQNGTSAAVASSVTSNQVHAESDQSNLNWASMRNEIDQVLAFQQKNGRAPIDQVLLVGDHAEAAILQEIFPSSSTVAIGYPLQGILKEGERLPPQCSLAAGLALKKYFPLLNTVDLLPYEQKAAIKLQRQKKQALHFILALGIFLLLSLLSLHVLTAAKTRELEETQDQLSVFDAEIARLDQMKKEGARLRQTLEDFRQLLTQRSQSARLLQEISSLMPEDVWLHELVTALPDTMKTPRENRSRNQLELQGWALNEEKVAAMLGRLESSSYFSEVHLRSTARLPASDVWQRSHLRKIPLIEFEVSVQHISGTE